MSQKISFNDRYGLTQAVLNGTKTMTRRLEKGLQRGIVEYEKMYHETFNFNTEYQSWGSTINKLVIGAPHATLYLPTRYKLGEIVAVAQAYKDIEEYNPKSYEDVMLDQGTICESSHPYSHLMKSGGWDNKMFVRADLMPHQIQITGVRIERLQAISYEDCIKEGIVEHMDSRGYCYYYVKGMDGWFHSPHEAFATLINRPGVGCKGLWESNPWVVVYQFKLVK